MYRFGSVGRTVAHVGLAGLLATMLHFSGGASAADGFSNAPQASRWGRDYLPNVEVVDQDGKAFHFFDDLIKDKLVVINFIYTTCTDICPLTTARLAQVQEKLGDIIGHSVFMYSITIDPEHDTPAAMKQHAEAFRVGPGWKFLTGKPEDINAIRYKLGERSKLLSEHRHEILLGNSATGNWSRDSAFGDLERVAFNIRSLDPNWRDEKRVAQGSNASYQEVTISDNQGEALFTKACAGCHTVGKGDRVGPDLLGVSSRRDRQWLAHFISEPDKMRAKNDPIATDLMQKFKGVRMPNLQISENDANDLITYLDVQTYAFNLSKGNPQHGQNSQQGHQHHNHN